MATVILIAGQSADFVQFGLSTAARTTAGAPVYGDEDSGTIAVLSGNDAIRGGTAADPLADIKGATALTKADFAA